MKFYFAGRWYTTPLWRRMRIRAGALMFRDNQTTVKLAGRHWA